MTPETKSVLIPQNAWLLIKEWKANCKTVVFTNGCFDVIHPGHVDILIRAKALGDKLIVGLNSDDSVKKLKGENRPILKQALRSMMLREMRSVDLVIIFDDETPADLIASIKPDILVKGADYAFSNVVGRELVESYGGKVVLLDLLNGFSTTDILQKLKSC